MMASKLEQVQTILRCPISKQGLRLLLPHELALLNTRIIKDELVHANNTPVKTFLEAGFISNDGQFVYPVLEGIIVLIENLAIPIDNQKGCAQINLNAEKKVLQDFYDSIGWQKEDPNTANFVDALKWEDLRPVASEYIHNCHLRVNRYINNKGQYLLDAGSGPVQYSDYLSYSKGYDFRICVDISFLALKEAQKKIGDTGIYILGDVTNIPLRDNVVDGAVSLHVIYHVPKDEQVSALHELHRVLKPSSSAAVVYSWPKSQMMEWWLFPRRIKREFRSMIQKTRSLIKKVLGMKNPANAARKVSTPETPYHFTHGQAYFENNLKGLDFDIVVWRSVSVPFLRMYIHPKLFGAAILRAIYRNEENNPTRYGRIGQYPLFVIRKK
jgi:ubiquinone/menaquinone biosynthesis C-methylase UbiE/uncharacterized protein YbaR (Trm112 family)